MKRVSILIPAYNSEAYIGETMQSCIDQTYPEVEVVVVDDGSTDGTLGVAREWESRYPNIRVFSQPNSGACRARNLAFAKSTGDYVMFLDADNVISTDKVSSQMERLIDSGDTMAVASGRWDRFKEDISEASFPLQHTYRDYDRAFDMLIDLWNNSEMFETACYLISRELAEKAGPWEESLKKNQDGEYFSRVLINGSKVLFCPEAKLYYRTGSNNNVSRDNSIAKVESLLNSFEMYERNALAYEDTPRVRKAVARNYNLFAYLYYGKHPHYGKKVLRKIKELGCSPEPAGTERTKMISRWLGPENFLRLRKFLLKY